MAKLKVNEGKILESVRISFSKKKEVVRRIKGYLRLENKYETGGKPTGPLET